MSDKKPRPGPIGFHAEKRATTQQYLSRDSGRGLGESSGPRKETVRGSSELKVASALGIGLVGAALIILGILFSLALAAFGVVVLVSAVAVNRSNRTERRVRDEFFGER